MGGSKQLRFLFSCGVLLTLAQPAWADFVGIVTVTNDDPDTVALCNHAEGEHIPSPLTVCRVSAEFDDPADRLLSVGNADLQVFDREEPSVFFQHPFNGSNTAPICVIGFMPCLMCDSFVTIGTLCGGAADGTSIDPDFDSTEFNSSGHIVGGWFNAYPMNWQGDAGWHPDLQVPILQSSVLRGMSMSGNLDVFWKDGDTSEIVAEEDLYVECPAECIADLDGDGQVNAADLAQLLVSWGPCPGCPADLNSDDAVNAADLAMLLGAWGACP